MKTNKLLSVVLTLCVLLAAFSLTALAADLFHCRRVLRGRR